MVRRKEDVVGLGYRYCPHSPVVHLCGHTQQAGVYRNVADVVGCPLAQSRALAKVRLTRTI